MPYKSLEARRAYMSEWQRRNREHRNQRARETYAAQLDSSREKARDKQRKWAKTNPEKVWAHRNPERLLEFQRLRRDDRQREAERRYSATHRDKRAAIWAKRKATKLNATPPWADLAAIELKYQESRALSEITSVPHHVDHIIPLKNERVCGLHVEWNLRVVPAVENMKKGNRIAAMNTLKAALGASVEIPAKVA